MKNLMNKLTLFTFLIALAPAGLLDAAARKPFFTAEYEDTDMELAGYTSSNSDDESGTSNESVFTRRPPSPFGYSQPVTTATPNYIHPRLGSYGWMERHPLTTLGAAFNNLVDATKNSKIIAQGALHRAVDSGNTAAAATALANGANPNKVNAATGWSPLHYACSDARCTEIVKLMIESGANIHKETKPDYVHSELVYGDTPLCIAVENDNERTVALLLEHHAEVTPDILELAKSHFIQEMLEAAQRG